MCRHVFMGTMQSPLLLGLMGLAWHPSITLGIHPYWTEELFVGRDWTVQSGVWVPSDWQRGRLDTLESAPRWPLMQTWWFSSQSLAVTSSSICFNTFLVARTISSWGATPPQNATGATAFGQEVRYRSSRRSAYFRELSESAQCFLSRNTSRSLCTGFDVDELPY